MRMNINIYRILFFSFFIAVFIGILPLLRFGKKSRIFIVSSQSMLPLISSGSLVVVRPEKEYKQGDIITFVNPESGPKEYSTITHRIRSTSLKNNQLFFETKGDANILSDPKFIKFDSIIGKVTNIFPVVGSLSNIIKSKIGFLLFIIIPGIIVIYHELLVVVEIIFKERSKKY